MTQCIRTKLLSFAIQISLSRPTESDREPRPCPVFQSGSPAEQRASEHPLGWAGRIPLLHGNPKDVCASSFLVLYPVCQSCHCPWCWCVMQRTKEQTHLDTPTPAASSNTRTPIHKHTQHTPVENIVN